MAIDVPQGDVNSICINYSVCSWQIGAGAPPMIAIAEQQPGWPLPFERPPDDLKAGIVGRAIAQAVDDGWLVAFGAGEWGAGVWWFSPDGSQRERLGFEHVVALLPRGDIVWAPGYGGEPWAGQVLRIEKDESARWRAQRISQPLLAPVDAAVLDGDRVLVATQDSVEAIDAAGNVAILARVDWFNDSPTSIRRTSDGVILVGMRHGIARLVPDGEHGYVEDWLVPPACRERGFVPGHLDCACSGLADPAVFSTDPSVMN